VVKEESAMQMNPARFFSRDCSDLNQIDLNNINGMNHDFFNFNVKSALQSYPDFNEISP
jgi:hypothetical protein